MHWPSAQPLLLTLLVCAGCAAPRAAQNAQPAPGSVQEAIRVRVEPHLVQSNGPANSLVVGVIHRGPGGYFPYGRADVGERTTLALGSMTRPLTALLVASYVADGTLKYEQDIGGSCKPSQLNAFCFRGASTTYADLVQDTSGLPEELAASGPDFSAADLQDFLAKFQLSIEPGKRFRSSTPGYAVLGSALARGIRVPFADAMTARVLTPMGMNDTTFMPAVPQPLWAAAGLSSTTADLLRLAEMNLHPDTVPELAEAIRLSQRVSSEIPASNESVVAHGWWYLERLDMFWYAAASQGSSAFVAFSPTHKVAVAITNDGSLSREAIVTVGFEVVDAVQGFDAE